MERGYLLAIDDPDAAVTHLTSATEGVDAAFARAELDKVAPHLLGPEERYGEITAEGVAGYLTWAAEVGVLERIPDDLVDSSFSRDGRYRGLRSARCARDSPAPGGVIEVLDGIDLLVEKRQFVTLLGPSGCGKSTMFDIIAGLEEPSSGEVLIDGAAERRAGRCGYMPQKDLLMPWKTVGDNVAVGRVAQGVARQQARSEADQVLSRFGLGDFAGLYPRVLSGGMRQRAALARTYLAGNDLLLLDEPFGGLDSLTRLQMQSWLLDVWRQTESAVLFITHDVDEAIRLGDRVRAHRAARLGGGGTGRRSGPAPPIRVGALSPSSPGSRRSLSDISTPDRWEWVIASWPGLRRRSGSPSSCS